MSVLSRWLRLCRGPVLRAVALSAAVALSSLGVLAAAGSIRGGVATAATSGGRADLVTQKPGYVGSAACATCHEAQARGWQPSHHAKAMAVASPDSIRGDFSDASAEEGGSRARFFRKDGRYFVETEGRDGKPAAFEISHTFGWEPLQQYLVSFEDGRLQVLPWAWDTRPKVEGGQRWFHVYGKDPIPPSDSRHWTRLQQTWNYMCAECHSTALSKGYDQASNTYRTTASEISIGCESCHGAGAAHRAWALEPQRSGLPGKGFAERVAERPPVAWAPDPRTGSPSVRGERPPGDEVELCARCHSRRGEVSEVWKPGQPLAQTHRETLLTPDLFEDDGQMKDEVFNDHSFKQSLMYARGVVCSDCHDVHSGSLKAAGSAVCSQCHLEDRFVSKAHTGHDPGPSSPDCVSCHMPARTYMQVDRRHDHSFRIPRPDVSAVAGTPNACTDCHADKSAGWAAAAVARWHGPERRGFQTWAVPFHAARLGDPDATAPLQALASDPAMPGVVRATAVGALAGTPAASVDLTLISALSDPDPLVRATALQAQERQPLALRWQRGRDLLRDPVLIVRLAAANLLADQPPDGLPADQRQALLAAIAEFEAARALDADRPEGRAALGLFRQRQGRLAEAETAYLGALSLEPEAAAVSVNLANLYRLQGKEAAAEQALRAAISVDPGAALPRHALGLSLVRSKRYAEALEQLRQATQLDPGNPRFAFVYAVALQSTGRGTDAATVLAEAAARHPYDADIVSARLQQALGSGDAAAARPLAETLSRLRPDDPEVARLAARLSGQ